MPSKKTKTKGGKARLDVLLVERGLAESRQRAQAMLLAGQVRVDGQRAEKAGARVPCGAQIEIVGEALPYASRGGLKLAGALEDFGVDVAGRACLDVGCSTGGFTDCLLQRGAARVYAVDVNTSQLAWKLRQDRRVVPIERNARYLQFEDVGESVNLATMDLSFISAAKVLPAVAPLVRPGGRLLILVKPQFELERKDVARGGVVRDAALQQRAVARVQKAAEELGLRVTGVRESRLAGAEGNREFFLCAARARVG